MTSNPQQIVFIDSHVPDLQDLLAGLQPGEQAFVIDPASDGLQQIADILAAHNFTNLSTISIVSHGAVGEVTLGATMLTDANLADHAAALAEIGASLGYGGTLQLFGCDVGQGAAGQQFVNDLAMFAGGINVAAATHDVGSAALGGSWTLDVSATPGASGAGPTANDVASRPESDSATPTFEGLQVGSSSSSGGLPTPASSSASTPTGSQGLQGLNVPFTQQAIKGFADVLANPVQTELWITASGGGPATELIHVDDNNGANSINNTTLWTPTSGNRPTQAYQIDDVALDPTNQFYFIVDANPGPVSGVPQAANAILKGNLGTELTNPSGTPSLTTVYYQSGTLGGASGTGFISGIALDTASQQIYFTERHSIERVNYNGLGLTTLATGGTSVFADGLALDLPHNQAFFFSNTTFSTSSSGHPIVSVSSNAIYVDSNLASASVVTPTKVTMSPADTHLAGGNFPVSLGLITGIAVDTVTEKLYFTTEPVADPSKFTGTGTGGIYEYDLTSNPGNTYHAVWVEPSNSSLFLTYIHIDDATNSYYVTDNNSTTGGGIYKGSLNSTAAPTLFTSIATSTVSPMSAEGFAFDNAPSLTITPANSTFTESTSNPASANNTPVSAITGATATDSDNASVFSATVSVGGFFAGDQLSDTTTGSITSSYNSSTGVLTLSGVDSFAHYQTVLDSVKLTSTSENPTDYGSDNSRTLTFSINDGLITSAPQTAVVTVVGVNDPPTLTGTATASFTEKGGAKTLSSGAAVADPDSLTLGGATVAIVGGTFAGDGDVLAATTTSTSITASYNSANETLTLSGSDTLAHYQSVLDSITFNSTSLNPTNYGSNTTRTVTWQINDGSGSFNTSTVVTSTLNVTAVNDPPTLTATVGSVAFTEGQVATLSPSVTISDPDSLTLAGATVKVTGGAFTGDGDVLAASVVGTGISASYDSSNEILTLSGSDTLAHYQQVLDKVTFTSGSNPDDYGSQKTRTVTWLLNDGGAVSSQSAAATTTVSITAINDPPALTSVAATASYLENAAQLTLASAASVSDVDSLTLASATVKIVGGTFSGDGDVLAVNGVSGGTIQLGSNIVTISYDSTTETLTLTGSDTLAHYQTLLEEVSFRTPSDDPTNLGANPTRILTWLLNDGSGSNNLSSPVTSTISVTAVNDPPTLSLGTTAASFTENGASFVLSPTVTVSDPDSPTWTGATVKIATGTFVGDGDVLAADTTGTAVTASYDAATETLFLSGTDTQADYKQVLQSVTFVTTSDNPTDYGSAPTRTVTWVANDGSGSNNLSTARTETVSITAVNDTPTLVSVAPTASYTEQGGAAVLASTLTVSDPDSLTLSNATVQITGGTFAGDGDVLTFSTSGTSITASYNALTETLTLSGSDSLVHYQSVLDSVAFSSTSHNPTDFGSNTTRTVAWLVNDGSGSSNLSAPATTTVTVTAVNDAPTLTGTATSVSFTENQASPVTLSPSVTVSDPDNQTLSGATVQIVGGTFTGDGDVLAFNTSGTSITASYNTGTETLTLSGADTFAHYQQVLDSVTFTTPSDNPTDYGSAPTRTLTWVLDDGSGANNLSTPATTTVNVTASNDPPTLSGVPAGVTFATGTTIPLALSATVTDPDSLTLASATVTVTGGTFAGDGDVLAFDTSGTSITASYDSTTEKLTLTGIDTLAHYNVVLESITFASGADPSNANSNPTRTLSWTTNDGSVTSAPQTETITVQNTPAVNPPAHAAFTENQASVALAPTLVVTDPNSGHLISATVALSGGTFAGDGDVLAFDTSGTSITANYDTTSEKLILSGSDTLAHYQQVLDSVTFTTPSDNPTDFGSFPSRTVTWTVVDDTGTTNATGTATSTIDITAVNDASSVVADASLSFTEGQTLAVSHNLTVTDVDSLGLVGATVSIAGGSFAGDGDVLSANVGGTSITTSYNSSTETLTLTGSDTLSHYNQVLDTVAFASGHNPDDFGSSPTRTVTWTVNDGQSQSAAATTTIGVTATNDPPTVTAAVTDTFVTGQTITLSPTLAVSDPDNLGLASATVSVGGSFTGDGDVLGFSTSGTSITASYDAVNEVLTLTGSDTVAHYQQVLDSVTFASGTDPTNSGSNATRTITWVANDGSAASAPQTTTVSLQLGPALVVTNAAFTENQASPVALDPTVALHDSNGGAQIASATVALTGGTFAGDGDVLAFNTSGTSITAVYDSTTEKLILSGLDSLTNYQQVLDSVTFTTPSDNPTDFGADPTRTVTWTVVDDSGSAVTSGSATSTIAITAVNDAPSVTAAPSVSFTEGATTAISSTLSISDVDSLGFVGATVSITGGSFAGDGDVLSANTSGTSIVASYDSTTETLTLLGADTLAHYQQVLDSVSFASGDNPDDFGSSPSRTVTWVLDDGGAVSNLSAAATTTIGVTAVNDPPTVTGEAAHVAFTVSSTVTLSSSVTLSDPDSQLLSSATVKITGGTFAGDGDVLGFDTTNTSITASYNSNTETLTLSGADTFAHYQQVLDSVTFASGTNPNNFGANPTRTVSWVVDDGSGVSSASAPVTTTVDIAHIPPTLSNVAATIAFTQGNTTTLSPAVTVTDIDSANLASATVKITGGSFAGDGDVLSATGNGTIVVSYDAATETLILTGTDTLAHYQTVLDSVKFSSGSDPTNHGSNPTRIVSWVVNDGNGSNGLSAAADSTITITPLDAAPTLSTVATSASFTENGSAVTLASALSVSDSDSTFMTSATVSIAGGAFVGDGDLLAATAAFNIAVAYDSTTETLTLTGSDSLAHYKQVLDSVTFVTPSDNPTDFGADPTRLITWTVADDFEVHSAAKTTTVNVTAVNDAPTLTSVAATVTYTSGTTLQLSPSVTVADPDSLDLVSATVKVAGGTFAGDGDVLGANVAGTHITASYDPATETLTLTGSDPLATYQSVLASITFSSGVNAGNFGSNLTRTITWLVNDGGSTSSASATSTTTLEVSTINTPPVLSNVPASVGFTEGQQLTLAGSAVVTDPDNIDLGGATVKIVGGTFAGDGDVLGFDTTGTSITASYNSATETLTLTGSDTIAHYQQVLEKITFASGLNPDDYGSSPTRVVTWVLDDGNSSNNLSTVQTTTIGITAINNPPTIAGAANAAFTENGPSVALSPGITVSDPDSLGIVGGSVQITGGTFAGDGDVLGFSTAGTAITAIYDSTSETLTLTGSDTFAHYQQVLDSVTFVTPSDNPDDYGSAPTRTVTWTLNDGAASSALATVTTTIGITATNDAPTLSGVVAGTTFTEKGAAVTLSGAAAVADPDNQKLTSATVKITGGSFAGDGDQLAVNVAGTSILGVYNLGTETLTLTGSDTLAHYQQVLDSLTFNSTSLNPDDYGSNTSRTVTWVLNDGSASNALSATATETVTIVAVNDAPTVSSVIAATSFTENGAAVTASPGLAVADPDNLTLVNATVSVANGFAGDGDVLSFNTSGTSITGSYNAATETLVLSGIDTVAHYQSVLDSVAFVTPSDNPTDYGSNLSRVLTWLVNDGSASNNLSTPQFTTIAITAINDAPTLSAVPSVKVLHIGQTLALAPVLALSDPDNLGLANATVKITGGTFASDGDVLAANVAGTGIAASYDATTETLTLTGSDTLAHYQQVLDSVTLASGADPTNAGLNPTRTLSWVVNDGSGSNNTAVATTTISISTLVKNDFNGDHKSDILFQDTAAAPVVGGRGHGGGGDVNSGVPQMYLMNGTTVTGQATLPNPSITWHIVGSGDFNGDGKSDILWQSTDGTPLIWTMNGPTVTSTTTLSDPGASWRAVGTADFNGDNKSDIVFQNSDGTPLIWLMNNTTVATPATLADPGASWRLVGTGDFNEDNKSDLVFQNSDGTPLIWEMNGTSVIATATLSDPGSAWRLVGTGDFNKDGISDLLFQSTDGTPLIWTMNGTSVAATTTLANPGAAYRAIGTGDYNADGKSDILFQNTTDGTPLVWTMNGTTVAASATLADPGINWHANTG